MKAPGSALGTVQYHKCRNGVADVASDTSRNTGRSCPSDDAPSVAGGPDHSIRPGVPIPATLLVAQMGDGALFLQGWRDGATAYVIPEDAGPLRHALATAFGSAGCDTTIDKKPEYRE